MISVSYNRDPWKSSLRTVGMTKIKFTILVTLVFNSIISEWYLTSEMQFDITWVIREFFDIDNNFEKENRKPSALVKKDMYH